MRVAVNNHALPVYKKCRLVSLLCIFKTTIIEFSLTVKAATLIFISGRGSAVSSAVEGKPGFIYNLVKS